MRISLLSVCGVAAAAGAAWAQPDSPLGANTRVEIAEVLVRGVFYPGIGSIRSISAYDVSDACWLGVQVTAVGAGADNLREVIAVGPHKYPLSPIAIGGELLPGTTLRATSLQAFSDFSMSRRGGVAYVANYVSSGQSGRGLFLQSGNNARQLCAFGSQAPGLANGVLFQSLTSAITLDENGSASFIGAIAGPGVTTASDRVMYTSFGGDPTVNFVEGTPISSLGGRVITIQNDIGSSSTSFFSSARVFTAAIGPNNDPAVVRLSPIAPVAIRNDPLPGDLSTHLSEFQPGPAAGVIYGFGPEFAYTVTLTGPNVNAGNRMAIVSSFHQTIVRAGDRAQGLGDGVRYVSFSSPVFYSSENHVLFHALLAGTGQGTSSALFAGPRDHIRAIAQAGTQAPGCPSGVLLGQFGAQLNNTPVFVNARGDVVFRSILTGAGVTPSNDVALFAYSERHGLQLIAREGDSFNFSGIRRTIATINLPERGGAISQTNGIDGRRTILNSHGECFFAVNYTDGLVALLKAQVAEPPCEADFNNDRFIDCFDYDAFVTAFEAGESEADQDADGFIDGFDYEAFVLAFEEGC